MKLLFSRQIFEKSSNIKRHKNSPSGSRVGGRTNMTNLAIAFRNFANASKNQLQWKPLIMITLRPALFDKNKRLITLSGGYKNLHYLTEFIVTTFYMYKKHQNLF
jgi:hypothetical protein